MGKMGDLWHPLSPLPRWERVSHLHSKTCRLPSLWDAQRGREWGVGVQEQRQKGNSAA